MKRTCLFVVGVSLMLSGCQSGPSAMVGKSLAEVEERFGKPDQKSPALVSTDRRAPQPRLLSVGDRYLYVFYSNLKGSQ